MPLTCLTLDPLVFGLPYRFTYEGCLLGWEEIGGVYIFASREQSGAWFPYYVGKTKNLRARLSNHERWQEARSRGAKLILTCVIDREVERHFVEHLLILTQRPVLNKQLVRVITR